MSTPVWIVELIKKTFGGRFLLAKLTRFRIAGRIIDRAFFEDDDIIFLPEDKVIPINKDISDTAGTILPSTVVDHFIEKAEYHWIMDRCICRDATKCGDYPIDMGCIFLGKAAMGINPKLGRRVSKNEALEHARKCREAGLVHLIGRNKLDTVWLNVRPGNRLLTVCNCCPCCCLWKMLPDVTPLIGDKVNRMPGVTVRVSDRCEGCGECSKGICFVDAIRLAGEKAVISESCRGCGRCVSECPHEAIEVFVENMNFVENAIERISSLVDVT